MVQQIRETTLSYKMDSIKIVNKIQLNWDSILGFEINLNIMVTCNANTSSTLIAADAV